MDVDEIQKKLRAAGERGNETARTYARALAQLTLREDKLAAIEDMKDDGLRFHFFMQQFVEYMEFRLRKHKGKVSHERRRGPNCDGVANAKLDVRRY